MRKKTAPKSSADVTESESNSSETMPTTSQNYFDASDSDDVGASLEAENVDQDGGKYQRSRKRKVVVQRQENSRSSSEEIDSDDSDKKCVLIIQHI